MIVSISSVIQMVECGLQPMQKNHEEECFLQFVVDSRDRSVTLHYTSAASKSFNYYDEIDEDLVNQYGLVNEMSQEMLAAISGLEFGEALKKLMSKNICNYSFRLLEDTTGLDKNTISNLRKERILRN